jgi:hypothetical protein
VLFICYLLFLNKGFFPCKPMLWATEIRSVQVIRRTTQHLEALPIGSASKHMADEGLCQEDAFGGSGVQIYRALAGEISGKGFGDGLIGSVTPLG